MSLTIFETGAIRIVVKHVEQRGSTFYFRRRIPQDVRSLYPDKRAFEFFSLKTTNVAEAAKRADIEARKQDALWKAHRNGSLGSSPEQLEAAQGLLRAFGLEPNQHQEYERNGIEPDEFFRYLAVQNGLPLGEGDPSDEVPGDVRAILTPHHRIALDLYRGDLKPVPSFSDAVRLHQETLGETQGSRDFHARWTAANRFIALTGDLQLNEFSREHARRFVSHMVDRGLKTSTIKRNINYISPAFNTGIREFEINLKNPFDNCRIPNFGKDTNSKDPFTTDEIRNVQIECRLKDDEMRHLVALISDTGMRVNEAAGLRVEDVFLNEEIPYIAVRPNELRGLKTDASAREIPLVGAALWSAKRRLEVLSAGPLFPRYMDGNKSTAKLRPRHAQIRLRSGTEV